MRFWVVIVIVCVGMLGNSPSHAAPVVASMEVTVGLAGTTPTLEQLAIRGDAFCTDCAEGKSIANDSLIINENGTIRGAIVYIKSGLTETSQAAPTTGALQMQIKCCRFTPRIMAARAGQTLRVSNEDKTIHNFNTRSKNNPRTNSMLINANGKREITRVFDKPDLPIRIQCDIHPWMVGYVGVFDHPYFAVTDKTGKFRFENLPPGEYKVGLWHETLGEREKEVTLGGGGVPAQLEFRLSAK